MKIEANKNKNKGLLRCDRGLYTLIYVTTIKMNKEKLVKKRSKNSKQSEHQAQIVYTQRTR